MAVYTEISNYILEMIEGELHPGDKLPGARQIADHISCSLPKVQAVLDSLEQSGIVESRERSGTFLREGYKERILTGNVACSKLMLALSGKNISTFRKNFPELHLTNDFRCGGVEIASSFEILIRQKHYQDLSSIFAECFPEPQKSFYMESLKPFQQNGKLIAIPVIFSPQLLWFNRKIFTKAGVACPNRKWSGTDFLNAIRKLHKVISGRRIINYNTSCHSWMSFLFSSGGHLLDSKLSDPVLADSPETIAICKQYNSLLQELDLAEDPPENPLRSFATGQMAMFAGFRQSSFYFKEYAPDFEPEAIYMPYLGGRVNYQGAGLIAFRKEFHDRAQIKSLLQYWLSDSVQVELGVQGYGIPFLRSAAAATLNPARTPDSLFLAGLPPLSSDFNLSTEEFGRLVQRASEVLNKLPEKEIPHFMKDLATTMRFLIRLEKYKES